MRHIINRLIHHTYIADVRLETKEDSGFAIPTEQTTRLDGTTTVARPLAVKQLAFYRFYGTL